MRLLYRIAVLSLLLIGAQAIWSQNWTIDKVVDNTTKCPGTTNGVFNPNGEFPAIYGDWVVFLDAGDDNCATGNGQSIWSYNLVTKVLTKLVDTGTPVPVPAGVGNFTSFAPISNANLQVNNGTVVFWGLDNGHNATYTECEGGIYTVSVSGGTIYRVVDYTMTLPGQGGYFCGLNNDTGITGIQGMSINGGVVVFSAQAVGSGYADDGVWSAPANVNTTEDDIQLIADSTTVYESPFPAGCTEPNCDTISQWSGGFIGGSTTAFTGGGGTSISGLFLNSIADPILQSNYVLPGDTDHNTAYPYTASNYVGPVIDGTNVFFIGSDPFYNGTCGNGGGSGQGTFAGVFETTFTGSTATSIMNTCDIQPSGDKLNGTSSFNYVVANNGTAVFQVLDDITGDYVLDYSTNGVVSELIGPGDPLPTGASCSGGYHAVGCATGISPPGTGGMNGGRLVFGASGGAYWYDNGIYIATLAGGPGANPPATMSSPAPGSTLTGPNATFSWTPETGATEYYLWLGSTGLGSNNLKNLGITSGASVAVTGLPVNGETIYARLWTSYNGVKVFNDYTYTASAQASMTSPAPNGSLPGPDATFTWTAANGATEYYLWLGSTGVGSSNLKNLGITTGDSVAVTGLPINGETIYARLWTSYSGVKVYNDYTYTASAQAEMTSPAPGGSLPGPNVTFTWTAAAGATEYYLWLGSTGVGSDNLKNLGITSGTSVAVTGLPVNGETIYARLFTSYNGVKVYFDYTYTATAQAAMTSPASGSTLAGANVTFSWTAAAGATEYYLWLGSTGAGSDNLKNLGITSGTSVAVTGLPVNGETIYARLWTSYNGTLVFNDYTYTAQ